MIRQDDTYPSKDWRSLVQLCDHKYLMRRRYQYMMENGYAAEDDVLLKDLEELEKESYESKSKVPIGAMLLFFMIVGLFLWWFF